MNEWAFLSSISGVSGPDGQQMQDNLPACDKGSQSMPSIHLYLSNTVKNPCRTTNWHSSVAHCDGTITGMDHWEHNPTRFSDPKPKRTTRSRRWLISGRMDQILPACLSVHILASEWLTQLISVACGFILCHSLTEWPVAVGGSRNNCVLGGGGGSDMLLLL